MFKKMSKTQTQIVPDTALLGFFCLSIYYLLIITIPDFELLTYPIK